MKVEVMISPVHGPQDPPRISITFKDGRNTLARVELAPEDFALAITGRLVIGELTRGHVKGTKPAVYSCCGIEFPEGLGKYGCPNCNGDNVAVIRPAASPPRL